MKKIHFIELGTGVDLRGGSVAKAALRAVRNAIGHNLLPSVPDLVGGDLDRLQVLVKLAVPVDGPIDEAAIRKVLPVGTVTFEVTRGGMVTDNGIGDQALMVNAAVVVGI